MRDWVATTEARLLAATVPSRLGHDAADRVWASMSVEEQRTWWIAWADGRGGDADLPTEPWRAALVMAIVRHGRRRARRTSAVLLVAVPVVLAVLMGVSPRDGIGAGVLWDLLPAVLVVAVVATWNEIRTSDVLARCRARAAATGHDGRA